MIPVSRERTSDVHQYYPVILQLGSKFIRAGFAGDALPVSVISTSDPIFNQQEITISPKPVISINHAIEGTLNVSNDLEDYIKGVHDNDYKSKKWLWDYDILSISDKSSYMYNIENLLERMVYQIYTKDLLIDAKKCKVIIPEPILLPKFIKKLISQVLLHHIHSQSILFVPEPILACVGSGIRNGLVVDIGWDSTSITPIFDLRILHNFIKTTNKAGKLLHYHILGQLRSLKLIDGLDDKASFEFIENFMCESLYCSTLNQNSNNEEWFEINSQYKIPNRLRHELIESFFFQDGSGFSDNDENYLVDIMKNILDSLPLDVRKELSTNIIFTGGLSNIPGIKTRILQGLREKSDLKIEATVSVGVWCGASIYCSTTLMSSSNFQKVNELTRDKYLNEEYTIPDWFDQMHDSVLRDNKPKKKSTISSH